MCVTRDTPYFSPLRTLACLVEENLPQLLDRDLQDRWIHHANATVPRGREGAGLVVSEIELVRGCFPFCYGKFTAPQLMEFREFECR